VGRAILVTGAAGFAGSHLLDHLNAGAAHGAPVVAWTRDTVDLLDRDAVRRGISELQPAFVYHCAGAAHVGESWSRTTDTLATNVLATHYLFDALRAVGQHCRVLIPGSAHVYAPSITPIPEDAALRPASPYAISKLAQEQLGAQALAQDGVDVVLTRAFNHTGPRQDPSFVAPSMARQIALIERGEADPVIKVGNLDAERDLTDVRDTVRAYVLLMERGVAGEVYNVASGVARSTRSVLETLISLSRVPVRSEVEPARLRPNDIPVLVGDASKLKAATGWEPRIAFGQMLADLLDYWRGR
jgi:GDP-4-dehydro-6-deoxy-D-mannose reductase